MKQSLTLRLCVCLLALVLTAVFLLPSFPVVKNSGLGNVLPDKEINFGLDLKGGIYLTLGVDVEKAVANSLAQAGQEIRGIMRSKSIQVTTPRQLTDGRLEFTMPDSSKEREFDAAIKEGFPNGQLEITRQALPAGGIRFMANFSPAEIKRIEESSLDLALTTIRNRINQFGVAEPDIRKQTTDNRIIVQLPGIDDTERAIQIIGQTAHLEFHIEYEPSRLDMSRVERGILPSDAMRIPMQGGRGDDFIIVHREAAMTGEYIENAQQSYDNNGRPDVSLTFNSRGAALFERITGESLHKRMAIVLDGVAHSAPVIQSKISGGRASITGNFTIREAEDLALVLRAGSLPAPVTVLEERTVGPSLGQESIDMGIRAAIIGLIAVMVFMVVYYSMSGVIATGMMVLDIAMLLAGMIALGATLTLPGIAGIVLTIGMAVDANVLIFERIREELRRGVNAAKAVDLGFSRATLTILDSNITTVIAAVILYQFGTGPIRGFAVTLTLGILVSMFTAIFVSRALFDLWITPKSAKISI